MDAIEQANSGHPGTPMGMAPVAYTLWQRFLRFDPANPIWPNRDRFVLSAGYASMLLYSMLFLTGVKSVDPDYEIPGTPSVTLDDIKRFRQPDSKCPGHPEYHMTSGVETTTGPLGSGVATSVGMAIAGRWLAERYNRPGFELFIFDVYALTGDGCMMEGVSSEAASLAGHLKLSNLCWIYDNNHITIEGNTSLAFSDDVAVRFLSYGWIVWRVGDANDLERLQNAFEIFKKTSDRPTLIIVDSHIAYGAPGKQDTSGAHGEPLGEETIRKTKKVYGWPEDARFLVPDEVVKNFAHGIGARGAQLSAGWYQCFDQYKAQYPDLALEIEQMQRRELPAGWDKDLPVFPADAKGLAGREASGKVLNAIARNHPWLLGGRVQRPLWASTGTKNPAYRDVVYIEELVGKNTVNTVPPATLAAFLDHGNVRANSLEEDLPGAYQAMARLEALGVSMASVTAELEAEGVQSFARAWKGLMDAMEVSRQAAVGEASLA